MLVITKLVASRLGFLGSPLTRPGAQTVYGWTVNSVGADARCPGLATVLKPLRVVVGSCTELGMVA